MKKRKILKYPVLISEPFMQASVFQKGWGELTLTSHSMIVRGKPQAGLASKALLGSGLAQAAQGEQGMRIPFEDILSVEAKKKTLTLKFYDERDREIIFYLKPYRRRGLLFGKDPMAEKLARLIGEHREGAQDEEGAEE